MTNDMQRDAFERWAAENNYPLVRFHPDNIGYASSAVNAAWLAWQAAIRHMREQEDKP